MSKELKKGTLLYLPEGEHEICATINGEPGKRRVSVTEACVAAFQRDLSAMLEAAEAGNAPRPCGFFDHKNGAAAFLPRGFRWQEGKGVMLDLEWTHAGQAAVEGKDYAYFSPRFALDGESPAGLLSDGVEVGSLVNDPAFRRMEEVAAGAPAPGPAPCPVFPLDVIEASGVILAQDNDVEKTEKACENLAMDEIKKMLGLPPDADDDAVKAAIAKLQGADKTQELEAAKSDLEKAKQDADKHKEELSAARAEIASLKASNEEAFIAEHVAAGRIAPKDDAAKETWKKLYRADAVAAAAAIGAIKPTTPGKESVVAGNVPDKTDNRSIDDLFAEKNK